MRLDKIHPLISGNKWFKLHPYLQLMRQQQNELLLTFGGAWSNHILATAAACNAENIPCAGIIRGEKPELLSPTLQDAAALGMDLYFVSRDAYRQKLIPEPLTQKNMLESSFRLSKKQANTEVSETTCTSLL